MAQLAVDGKNVLIKILKEGQYVPYACAVSVDYYKDRELIETSTVDSAGESEFEYGMGSWELTLNGVTHIVKSEATGITVFEMLQKQINKDVADIELSFGDSDGNIKTITGRVLIAHVGISAGAEGFSEDDIELKGTGVATIDTILIEPVINDNEVFPLEFTSESGGETSVQFDELIGKTVGEILYVGRDGTGKDVIDVGSPTDKQVKFISGTGTISLPYELGLSEWVLILYK